MRLMMGIMFSEFLMIRECLALRFTRAKVLAHKVVKVSISLNAFERRTESARSELLYDPAINRCVGGFLCTLSVV